MLCFDCVFFWVLSCRKPHYNSRSKYLISKSPCELLVPRKILVLPIFVILLTHSQGSHLENLKNMEFCHFLFQTWKMPGICSKIGKNPKNLNFANSMFQASLFRMSLTKIIVIYIFVISTLSTQTLIRSQIDLGFHFTWK